jgi:hypothetical protein
LEKRGKQGGRAIVVNLEGLDLKLKLACSIVPVPHLCARKANFFAITDWVIIIWMVGAGIEGVVGPRG